MPSPSPPSPAKPADARPGERAARLKNESIDRPRLLGLAHAARALVGPDDVRTRDLVDELVEALECAGDVVRLADRRAKVPR
jgi:hypothetical protein